jgi:5-methylcytosine-specific restriction enzyme A
MRKVPLSVVKKEMYKHNESLFFTLYNRRSLMFTSKNLVEGGIYTRQDLQQNFSVHDATIRNGVFKHPMYHSVWLFVTEQKTKDRPQLRDYLDGDILHWDGQPRGRTDRLIVEHESKGLELLVFYRKHRKALTNFGFKYEGRFRYKSHEGSRPAHFILQRIDSVLATVIEDIEAIRKEESSSEEAFREGKMVSVLTNKHERNPNLRAASIKNHGTRCQVCSFSFSETYGLLGKGFIEVHHLYPVSKYTDEVTIDPLMDMSVVCSNCHRMIHRNAERPLSIEELRQIIAANRKSKSIQ